MIKIAQRMILLPPILCIALTACDRTPPPVELKNVPLQRVGKVIAERVKLKEGMWESNGKITGYSMGTLVDDDQMTRHIVQVMQMKMSKQPTAKMSFCLDSKKPAMFLIPDVAVDACKADYFRMEGN